MNNHDWQVGITSDARVILGLRTNDPEKPSLAIRMDVAEARIMRDTISRIADIIDPEGAAPGVERVDLSPSEVDRIVTKLEQRGFSLVQKAQIVETVRAAEAGGRSHATEVYRANGAAGPVEDNNNIEAHEEAPKPDGRKGPRAKRKETFPHPITGKMTKFRYGRSPKVQMSDADKKFVMDQLRAIHKAGVSIETIAKAAGVSHQLIRRLENGLLPSQTYWDAMRPVIDRYFDESVGG